MTIRTEYVRLTADIKEHLIQEYQSGDWLSSSAETYSYFKQLAMQNKQPVQAIKPPLVQPSAAPVKSVVHAVIKAPPLKPVEKKIEPQKTEAVPIPEVKKEEKQPLSKSGFQPSPMTPTSPIDLSDIRKIIQEHYPHLQIIDKIPTHNPEVAILTSIDDPFFTHLARAIDSLLAPAVIVKSLPQNHTLKLVISSIPLDIPHLLVDPAIYRQNPLDKAQLWQEIKAFLIKN